MTDILYKKFRKTFPPINGFERVGFYEAYERIYLNLVDKAFANSPEFNDTQKIRDIASKIFDVDFDFGTHGTISGLFFEPKMDFNQKYTSKRNKYLRNYDEHLITMNFPMSYPAMEIWTGNRGKGILLPAQRDKYFYFVTTVFEEFKKHVK